MYYGNKRLDKLDKICYYTTMKKEIEQKPYQFLAWIATAVLLVAATMAAFNMYPYYSYAFTVANGLWVLIGVLWKEKSLIVLNAGLTIIYLVGLFAQ